MLLTHPPRLFSQGTRNLRTNWPRLSTKMWTEDGWPCLTQSTARAPATAYMDTTLPHVIPTGKQTSLGYVSCLYLCLWIDVDKPGCSSLMYCVWKGSLCLSNSSWYRFSLAATEQLFDKWEAKISHFIQNADSVLHGGRISCLESINHHIYLNINAPFPVLMGANLSQHQASTPISSMVSLLHILWPDTEHVGQSADLVLK